MAARGLATGAIAASLILALVALPALSQEPSPAPPGARDTFRWPLRGPILHPFTSGENDGVDITASLGEWVHAAADGICTYAGEDIKTYGKLILIRHANGHVTAYADNSELMVKEGDDVKRGQIIARAGASGDVSSPRLHFELRKDGQPVDPLKYLAPL